MKIEARYRPWLVVGVIVIILIVGYAFSKPGPEAPANQTENTDQAAAPEDNAVAGQYAGMLRASDNPKKGNLMLQNPEHTIYLSTSRDFSQLIGRDVVLQIDGTLDQFRLVDIRLK